MTGDTIVLGAMAFCRLFRDQKLSGWMLYGDFLFRSLNGTGTDGKT